MMKSYSKAYWAWFSVALFFLYQYLLRVAPGVMSDELRQAFKLTAQQFGSLGAYYLYAYSLLQIPLGLLMDRLGIRYTVLGSIVLCMLSTILMAHATQFWMLALSRLLLGVGSATAFMGALKVAADYLPAGRRGLLMGLTLTMGTLGALAAGKPLVYLLKIFSWQETMLLTLVISAFVFALGIVFLPKRTRELDVNDINPALILSQMRSIFRNRQVMLYAVLAIGLYTPLAAIADLWGTSFLKQKFMLVRDDAAQMSMLMYVGLALGSIVLPWLCERYNLLDRGIQVCGALLLLLFSTLLYGPELSTTSLAFILIAIGCMCGAEMMCFTGTAMHTTSENSGITIGVVNTMNMLGGALMQYIIGFGLDLQWEGTYDQYHLRAYSTEQFTFSLSTLAIVIMVCCALSLKLRARKEGR